MKIWRPRWGIALGLVALAASLRSIGAGAVGAADPSSTIEQRVTQLEYAESLRQGTVVFRRTCAACHGVGGKGDGPGAADLDPSPRDLTTRGFRFRTTLNGDTPRPEDLERVIREGLPGSAMPGFGDLLSNDELSGLVAFIYSLQSWLSPEDELPDAISFSPVASADNVSVEDGHAIYLLAGCWRCHGLDGSGDGPSAKGLTDEEERPMRSTDFRHDPFKGGRTAEAIVRALRTGLNGTPMPSYDSAMLITRSDSASAEALEGQISSEAQSIVEAFIANSPTSDSLDSMTDDTRGALRDRRLAALAYYVLSFDRRNRASSKLFRQTPETEARKQ